MAIEQNIQGVQVGRNVKVGDVAKRSGVSDCYVYQALKHDPHQNQEKAEKVRKIAEEMGFVVKPAVKKNVPVVEQMVMPIVQEENPDRVVTAKDVAEKVGCSGWVVHLVAKGAYKKHGISEGLAERVRQAIREMGYDSKKARSHSKKTISVDMKQFEEGHIATMQDIADCCGVSLSMVKHVFSGDKKVNKENAEIVLRVAQEIGYDPKKASEMKCAIRLDKLAKEKRQCSVCGMEYNPKASNQKYCAKCAADKRRETDLLSKAKRKGQTEHFYYNGNYHSKAEEVARMKQLRAEGFSNKEIAEKIGRSCITVRAGIGKQSPDMTKENRVQGAKNRAARNEQRRRYVATHTVNVFNEAVTKLDELGKEISRMQVTHVKLTAEIKAMLPAVKEAAKTSKVQPMEIPTMPSIEASAAPVQ